MLRDYGTECYILIDRNSMFSYLRSSYYTPNEEPSKTLNTFFFRRNVFHFCTLIFVEIHYIIGRKRFETKPSLPVTDENRLHQRKRVHG
jgi:hypothetical protein